MSPCHPFDMNIGIKLSLCHCLMGVENVVMILTHRNWSWKWGQGHIHSTRELCEPGTKEFQIPFRVKDRSHERRLWLEIEKQTMTSIWVMDSEQLRERTPSEESLPRTCFKVMNGRSLKKDPTQGHSKMSQGVKLCVTQGWWPKFIPRTQLAKTEKQLQQVVFWF